MPMRSALPMFAAALATLAVAALAPRPADAQEQAERRPSHCIALVENVPGLRYLHRASFTEPVAADGMRQGGAEPGARQKLEGHAGEETVGEEGEGGEGRFPHASRLLSIDAVPRNEGLHGLGPRVALLEAAQSGGERVELVFFYSGHADADAAAMWLRVRPLGLGLGHGRSPDGSAGTRTSSSRGGRSSRVFRPLTPSSSNRRAAGMTCRSSAPTAWL